jgi:hypothetical protein
MDVFQARLAATLREVLESKIDSECKRMVSTPAEDFTAYARRIGFIKGLQDALQELTEIAQKFDRAESNKAPAPQSRRRYEE